MPWLQHCPAQLGMTDHDSERFFATNIEIRITKFETNSNVQKSNDQNEFCGKPFVLRSFANLPFWSFEFSFLNLFRISDFVLRVLMAQDRPLLWPVI